MVGGVGCGAHSTCNVKIFITDSPTVIPHTMTATDEVVIVSSGNVIVGEGWVSGWSKTTLLPLS